MVIYKLGIFNNKQSVLEIILDFINNKNSLQMLDKITSEFKDENELKAYLINKGLISLSDIKKKISIIYKYNSEYNKLPIIYKTDKEYLDGIYLHYKLHSMSSNIDFLEKLANHYSTGSAKYNPQGLNVSDIRNYLSDVRQCGHTFDSKMLYTTLSDMSLKATSILDKKTGELKENYRGLRDLALFITKYEKKQELLKEKQELQNIKKEHLNTNFEPITGEQITLFDLLAASNNKDNINNKKWVLSSEGEPDFPPNSEEERKYNEYLESLQSEDYLEEPDFGHRK